MSGVSAAILYLVAAWSEVMMVAEGSSLPRPGVAGRVATTGWNMVLVLERVEVVTTALDRESRTRERTRRRRWWTKGSLA